MFNGTGKVGIDSIQYHLPDTEISLDQLLSENPSWKTGDIFKKLGTKRLFTCAENETSADLAIKAAEKIFEHTGREDIDCLIFVTQTPDYKLPTTACVIQARLGLSNDCMAFDVNQGCSGFVYGLALGTSLIQSGVASRVLLLCGETYTKHIGRHDRTCRPIFSDAGSATILSKSGGGRIGPFVFKTDGSGYKDLILRNSGTRRDSDIDTCEISMNGPAVLMFTLREVPSVVNNLLSKSRLAFSEVDMFFFHQASQVVLSNLSNKLTLPDEKVFVNLKDVGNTVSSSIPIALCDAAKAGKINSNDKLILVGYGVGLSVGACVLDWG